MEKILDSVKKANQIEIIDTSFDDELVLFTNGVVSVLTQLGVGPEEGLEITKDSLWTDFIGERKDLDIVKNYVAMKVKILFDPPGNSFLVSAIEKYCDECEWRIEVLTNPFVVEVTELVNEEEGGFIDE